MRMRMTFNVGRVLVFNPPLLETGLPPVKKLAFGTAVGKSLVVLREILGRRVAAQVEIERKV